MKVKMLKSGRYADPQPHLPQIEAKEGDELDVNPAMAASLCDCGAAEVINEAPAKEAPAKQVKQKSEKAPAKADKDKAEG